MGNGIYVGMAGAVARTEQLEAIADNLANAQTPGFKASQPAFEAFLPPTGGERWLPGAVATGIDRRAGATVRTGDPLHLVPENDLFLAVQTASGNTAYTRDGRLSVDAGGNLRAGENLVLGASGSPISIAPGQIPTLSPDGTVAVNGAPVGRLGLHRIDGALDRLGPSLYGPGTGGNVEAVEGRIRTGELEQGNVTPLEAAVGMITAQRGYETSMQAIETYKKLGERSTELGRLR